MVKLGDNSIMLFLAIVILAVVIFIANRGPRNDYNAGSGIFKNSEFNVDENKKDFSDVEYYNNDKNNNIRK